MNRLVIWLVVLIGALLLCIGGTLIDITPAGVSRKAVMTASVDAVGRAETAGVSRESVTTASVDSVGRVETASVQPTSTNTIVAQTRVIFRAIMQHEVSPKVVLPHFV